MHAPHMHDYVCMQRGLDAQAQSCRARSDEAADHKPWKKQSSVLLVPEFDGAVLGAGEKEVALVLVGHQARNDVVMLPVCDLLTPLVSRNSNSKPNLAKRPQNRCTAPNA